MGVGAKPLDLPSPDESSDDIAFGVRSALGLNGSRKVAAQDSTISKDVGIKGLNYLCISAFASAIKWDFEGDLTIRRVLSSPADLDQDLVRFGLWNWNTGSLKNRRSANSLGEEGFRRHDVF